MLTYGGVGGGTFGGAGSVITGTFSGTGALTGGNTWFVPTGGSSGTTVSAPADVTEDTLATVTIPILSANAVIRVTLLGTFTASTNAKTYKVKWGGTTFANYNTTSAGVASICAQFTIQNGATNAQVSEGATGGSAVGTPWGFGGNAPTTAAIDTTAATTLTITGQKGSSGETLSLSSYLIEILKP